MGMQGLRELHGELVLTGGERQLTRRLRHVVHRDLMAWPVLSRQTAILYFGAGLREVASACR
jgi:hypothetical protein